MRTFYYTAALVGALALAPGAAAGSPQGEGATTHFTVFLNSTPVGAEELTVERKPDGSTITSSNRLGPPVNLVVRKATIRYDASWRPAEFALDATVRDQWTSVYTKFAGGSAVSDVREIGQQVTRTATVAADTIVISNTFFGGYQVLASRLAGLSTGAELRLFYVPQSEVAIKLNAATDEQLRTGTLLIQARRYSLTIMSPGVPLDVELWADAEGGLLRFTVPAQSLDVVRNDIATVATRRETMARQNDETPMIPGTGFNIASTVSKPAGFVPAKNRRLPAVVLVGGTGPADRDETTAGVPIFAELAGAIADAGFLVVRFDKRGTAQSGGRAESATLADYAEDVRSVVKYLQRRKDVDKNRIAVVGHGEGGWIALAAARSEKAIRALAVLATAGTTGAELILEQQRRILGRLEISEPDRQARIDLQRRIQQAVVSGSGWEGIAPSVRRQAETPWFRSYLAFNPIALLPKIERPILVVHGELDREVPPQHAQTLMAAAEGRKRRKGQSETLVRVPGVNHLLVPATTGEVDEYTRLAGKKLSPEVVTPLTSWLAKLFVQPAR